MKREVGPTDDGRRRHSPVHRIDAACDRFEAAWRAGQLPRIEDVLAGADAADGPALLQELLALEIDLRRGRGERAMPGEYRFRFPADGDVIDAAFAAMDSGPANGTPRPGRALADTGRNLLFGLLALQNNFVGRDALLAAFAACVSDRSRPLGRILRDSAALDDARHALLEALVAEHLKLHGDDPERSLAALSSIGSVRRDLELIGDPDVQASLAAAAPRPAGADGDARAAGGESASRRAGERFRILRFHREGGLGRVFVARDGELGRQVALKEIRPDKVSDAGLRGRFVLEAEINGGLEHPGIVPVYSLGTYDDGRPFYAMRFVEGDSLKEAIESYHREHPRPDPSAVEFRRLLGRFIDVCEAIAFAHSKGVLHRDLKPHNVMLGRYGETLLIDWGLAKATGRREPAGAKAAVEATLVPPSGSGHAPTLGVLGSPPYMSPEQAAGATESFSPATDVYGLGAILFALLTGKPPVEGETTEEVLERVRRGAIRSPRWLNPNIPRALEAVCLKALASDPRGRYATALALAEDVEHWLADEPVTAWREPIPVRAQRWARRNRSAVTGAAVALLVGVIGLSAVATVQVRANSALEAKNLQLTAANAATERALTQTEKEKKKTEAALMQSEESQKQAEAVSTFLVNAFRSPDPARTGRDVRVAEVLDRAVEKLDQAFAGSPVTKGALLDAIGRTYFGLGLYDQAVSVYSRARSVREISAGPDHIDTLRSRNSLANAYLAAGRLREAIALHEGTLKLIEIKLGPDHPETLKSRNNLAAAYVDAGRTAEAIALHETTLKRRETKLGPDHPDTLGSRDNLAIAYVHSGRPSEAIALFQSTFKLRAAALGPDHPDTLNSRDNLAAAYYEAGRLAESIVLHESTLKLYEAKLGPDHPDTLITRYNLANAYRITGRLSEATERLEATLELMEAKLGPNHPYTLQCHGDLAEAYESLGRFSQAERLHLDVLVRRRETVPTDDPLLAGDLAQLSRNLLRQARGSEAEPLLREALAIRAKGTPDDWEHYDAMSLLGESLLGQGRYGEAERPVLDGYEGMKARESRIPVPNRSRLREAAERVVRLYEALGRTEQAAAWKAKLGMPDLPADVFARP
jgi:eukaryotic-like serine/threonine-protein kinase